MPARPAIVTTLRDADAVIDSFVNYHLAIGFAKIILFFDDPHDSCLARFRDHPDVIAIPHDDDLRARWQQLTWWDYMQDHLHDEVMSRQVLNAELAVSLAADAGCDWLLHIDSDEAFCCASGDASLAFQRMASRGLPLVEFMNFEALPETLEVNDYFREVTLFKVNLNRLGQPRFQSTEQTELLNRARFTDGGTHIFNLYSGCKAAGQVIPGLVPQGVHRFSRKDAGNHPNMVSTIIDDNAIILHYANCGLQNFTTKYATLGAFGDKWFGEHDVIPFHLAARNVCATGDADAIREFYQRRVMLSPDEDVAALLAHGILARITQPADVLRSLGPAPSYRARTTPAGSR